MIRSICNDDELWRQTLRGLNKNFYHKTVSTRDIEEYISESIGIDLTKIFDQYLRDVRLPVLEYYFDKESLYYRWNNVINEFVMQVEVNLDDRKFILNPTTNWNELTINKLKKDLIINNNYYVNSKLKDVN